MQKGFNSDITYNGHTYHIQSEDWGSLNPFLVSRVFRSGEIVKSFKTPYQDICAHPEYLTEQDLGRALREQHNKILDLLISGQITTDSLK